MDIYKWGWQYFNRKMKIQIGCFCALLFLLCIFQQSIPFIFSFLIDNIFNNDIIFFCTIILILLTFVAAFSKLFSRIVYANVSNNLIHNIMKNFLKTVYNLEHAAIEKNELNTLVSSLDIIMISIRKLADELFSALYKNMVSLIIASVFLIQIHWLLFVITILSYIPYFFFEKKFENNIKATIEKQAESKTITNTVLYDNLSLFEEYQLYLNGDLAKRRLNESMSLFLKDRKKTVNIRYWRGTFYRLISTFGIIFSFLSSIFLYNQKMITLGEVSVAFVYTGGIIWVLNGIFYTLTEQDLSLSQIRLFKDKMTTLQKMGKNTLYDTAERKYISNIYIDFYHVDFSYLAGHKILEDVSFNIKPQEKVLFIGESGSGKSTIFKLLTGEVISNTGEIRFFSKDKKQLNEEDFINSCAIFFADCYIWSTSILENITFGNQFVSKQEVITAAKCACIYEDIMKLPQGFDTLLNSKKNEFSGGQIQRIILARIFLNKAPIMILDECLSALDGQTVDKIEQNIITSFPDRTVIMISHNSKNLEKFDSVYTIQDKKLIRKEVVK